MGAKIFCQSRVAPCLDNNNFDPEVEEQLKLAAEELMQEFHEECDRKAVARENSNSERCDAKVGSEQADNSGVAGMRVDNRYYLTVVLGGQEYKALFDPGATLSLAGPRVTEVLKDRLKEYDSVIRRVNGKVTPVLGVLDLMIDVDGEPKIISVKAVAELDDNLIFGMDFCKEFDIDARLAIERRRMEAFCGKRSERRSADIRRVRGYLRSCN